MFKFECTWFGSLIQNYTNRDLEHIDTLFSYHCIGAKVLKKGNKMFEISEAT